MTLMFAAIQIIGINYKIITHWTSYYARILFLCPTGGQGRCRSFFYSGYVLFFAFCLSESRGRAGCCHMFKFQIPLLTNKSSGTPTGTVTHSWYQWSHLTFLAESHSLVWTAYLTGSCWESLTKRFIRMNELVSYFTSVIAQ